MFFDTRYSEKDKMTYVIQDEAVSIVRYEADEGSVAIPAAIEGLPVTRIEAYAFSGKQMKYVIFPETLRVIDHHGFSECRQVKRLQFPEHLSWIGNYAFYNCWGLEQVHLTPYIKSIGYGAFKNCEKLYEIIQDKAEGWDISIGSLLDDLDQQIHVIMRHVYPDKPVEEGRVIFTAHDYEIVANVASMCKQFESTEIGSGKYLRYCIGIHDVDYAKYDSMFYVLLRGDSFDTIITVAIERLMYPYALAREAAASYRSYIEEHSREALLKFLKDDDREKLSYLLEMGVCKAEDIDEALELASDRQMAEYTAILMDYRHSHFSMADESFDL